MKSKRMYKLLLCLPLVTGALFTAPRPAHAFDCVNLCNRAYNLCITEGSGSQQQCNTNLHDCLLEC